MHSPVSRVLALLRVGAAGMLSVSLASTLSAAVVPISTHQFTVPSGFTVELAAGSDLAPRPVSASLDDLGRLYVTDSSGSNEDPEKQLKDPKSRLLRLEDTDGDGRYDRTVVFADRVMFPQGCLWHDGWVYVAGPPSIWRFRDRDGDGVAEVREEWFKGGTLTHCANDIHGPHLGPDGYIYWTKGAFSEQRHERPSKKPVHDRAAHIYRSKPDGSDLDIIMSGGMDNPVEVAFTPEGEALFTSTFIDFSQPGWRDGIGHAIYGSVFGKQNDVIEDGRVVRTSPEWLHPFVQLGAGAPSGLCRYESTALGAEFENALFASTFNLHKITAHRLRPNGASFTSTNLDFLVSDNLDFHPTDVLEDIDGSLLVVDTGGWYKLCCPSSQLAKADVLGGIYRVRHSSSTPAQRKQDLNPARTLSRPEDLVSLLSSPNATIRRNTANRLVELSSASIAALASSIRSIPAGAAGAALAQGKAALWSLFRIGSEPAFNALSEALPHPHNEMQQVALKCWALSGRPATSLVPLLAKENPTVSRIVCEALARSPVPMATSALLKLASESGSDPFLEHASLFALIQSGAVRELHTALRLSNPPLQRAALIALDQMEGGRLTAEHVGALLHSPDPKLRQAAAWVARRHSEWAGSFVTLFKEKLAGPQVDPGIVAEWETQLPLLTRAEAGQKFLSELAIQSTGRTQTRVAALNAIASSGLKDPPAAWTQSLLAIVGGPGTGSVSNASLSGPDEVLKTALRAARQWPASPELAAALHSLADRSQVSEEIRLAALSAIPKGFSLTDAEISLVESSLSPSGPVNIRTAAAEVVSRVKWTPAQLVRVAGWLKSAGPLEFPKLMTAFDVGGDESLGKEWLSALKSMTKTSMIRPDLLRPRLSKFPVPIQEAGEAFLASLNQDLPQQTAKLNHLSEELKHFTGDIRRGQAVFNSPQAACVTCHAIGYQGGRVGPDLTTISTVRSEKDLLEAIVFPSASFVRSYEPVVLSTKDGEQVVGVLKEETAEFVRVAAGPDNEMRLARADISEMKPGAVSIMPSGLDEQLSRQQLADLLSFLKNTKWGPQ